MVNFPPNVCRTEMILIRVIARVFRQMRPNLLQFVKTLMSMILEIRLIRSDRWMAGDSMAFDRKVALRENVVLRVGPGKAQVPAVLVLFERPRGSTFANFKFGQSCCHVLSSESVCLPLPFTFISSPGGPASALAGRGTCLSPMREIGFAEARSAFRQACSPNLLTHSISTA